jgi:hypothetical protein
VKKLVINQCFGSIESENDWRVELKASGTEPIVGNGGASIDR